MYVAHAGGAPGVVDDALRLVQQAGLALLAGWTAARLLDTGSSARGVSLLCGVAGLHAGTWLWGAAGWPHGPVLGGHAILPAFVGALVVSAALKLVGLGAAGPRR